MNPIDYSGAMADLPTPSASFMQGVKDGAGVQQLAQQQEQQQIMAERARAQQEQMAVDMRALYDNPTPAAIARTSLKYPQLSEQFKRSYDMLDGAQKQSNLESMSRIDAALQSSRPDIADKLMREHATALRNSGKEQEARATEAMADSFKLDEKYARMTSGKMMAAMAGPEKYAASMAAIGGEERPGDLHGAAVSKAESDAMKAGVDASVAQDTAGLKVEQAGEDVKTAQAKREIDRLTIEIDQANSETKRGQLVLERDKLIAEQGLKAVERGEGAQAQIDSAQHALNTINSLRADPMMKESAGNWAAGMGTLLGKFLGAVPGTENKDFRGQLESLKAQVFLPAVQQVKGMGALSNAEGEKLTAAVAALDADMSPKAFQSAMGVVERYMTKGLQKGLSNKAVPVQGGGFVANHPTFGKVTEGDVNRLMKQYPGTTRETVMQYLNAGGK